MNQPLDDNLLDAYLDEWAKQFDEQQPCEGDFQDAYPDLGSGLTEGANWSHASGLKDHHIFTAPYELDDQFDGFMVPSFRPFLDTLSPQQIAASPATIHRAPQVVTAPRNEVLHTRKQTEGSSHLFNADINQAFRFESRAVVLENLSRRSNTAKPVRVPGNFKCEFPDCKYRGTFRRSYELNRHMTKHTEKQRFPCPVQYCDSTFYRTDKISLHLKQAHTTDEDSICPLPGCGAGPYPLRLLVVHAYVKHDAKSNDPALWGIFWLKNRTRCPMPSCKQWKYVHDIQKHIRSHNSGERLENESVIRKAGFDVRANIICPICETSSSTITDFTNHMYPHLVTDIAHLQACGLAYRYLPRANADVLTWESWTFWPPVPPVSHFLCTFCGDKMQKGNSNVIDHHLDLLQDPATIRPFRLQLLELLGHAFSSHPVFDDLKV